MSLGAVACQTGRNACQHEPGKQASMTVRDWRPATSGSRRATTRLQLLAWCLSSRAMAVTLLLLAPCSTNTCETARQRACVCFSVEPAAERNRLACLWQCLNMLLQFEVLLLRRLRRRCGVCWWDLQGTGGVKAMTDLSCHSLPNSTLIAQALYHHQRFRPCIVRAAVSTSRSSRCSPPCLTVQGWT